MQKKIVKSVKINIGSGNIGKDDWINIDKSILAILAKHRSLRTFLVKIGVLPKIYNVDWPKNLLIHDIRKRLPFEDKSVKFIFTSHFLEHLTRFEGKNLINECYRIAENNAVIRIVVPDLELLVQKYLKKDEQFLLKLKENQLTYIPALRNEKLSFADIISFYFYGKGNVIKRKEGFKGFLEKKLTSEHKWMYDFNSLKLLLESAGFKNIRRCNYQEGKMPDLDALDTTPEESMYIEAEKIEMIGKDVEHSG